MAEKENLDAKFKEIMERTGLNYSTIEFSVRAKTAVVKADEHGTLDKIMCAISPKTTPQVLGALADITVDRPDLTKENIETIFNLGHDRLSICACRLLAEGHSLEDISDIMNYKQDAADKNYAERGVNEDVIVVVAEYKNGHEWYAEELDYMNIIAHKDTFPFADLFEKEIQQYDQRHHASQLIETYNNILLQFDSPGTFADHRPEEFSPAQLKAISNAFNYNCIDKLDFLVDPNVSHEDMSNLIDAARSNPDITKEEFLSIFNLRDRTQGPIADFKGGQLLGYACDFAEKGIHPSKIPGIMNFKENSKDINYFQHHIDPYDIYVAESYAHGDRETADKIFAYSSMSKDHPLYLYFQDSIEKAKASDNLTAGDNVLNGTETLSVPTSTDDKDRNDISQ